MDTTGMFIFRGMMMLGTWAFWLALVYACGSYLGDFFKDVVFKEYMNERTAEVSGHVVVVAIIVVAYLLGRFV